MALRVLRLAKFSTSKRNSTYEKGSECEGERQRGRVEKREGRSRRKAMENIQASNQNIPISPHGYQSHDLATTSSENSPAFYPLVLLESDEELKSLLNLATLIDREIFLSTFSE